VQQDRGVKAELRKLPEAARYGYTRYDYTRYDYTRYDYTGAAEGTVAAICVMSAPRLARGPGAML
jgi:hypothetical protein